jgi:transposase
MKGEELTKHLEMMLNHIGSLDSQVSVLDEEIENRLLPIQDKVDLIDSIPGIAKRSTQVVISQIGIKAN